MKEETGLEVKPEDLLELPQKYKADLPRKNGDILHVSHTVFATNKFSGELASSDEAIPCWIPINSLKDRELLPNIADMVEKAQKTLQR